MRCMYCGEERAEKDGFLPLKGDAQRYCVKCYRKLHRIGGAVVVPVVRECWRCGKPANTHPDAVTWNCPHCRYDNDPRTTRTTPPVPEPKKPPPTTTHRPYSEFAGPGWGRQFAAGEKPTTEIEQLGYLQLTLARLSQLVQEVSDLHCTIVRQANQAAKERKAERKAAPPPETRVQKRDRLRAESLARTTAVWEAGQRREAEKAARRQRYIETVAAVCDLIVSYEEFGFPFAPAEAHP